jgi:hypothetical protein
MAIFNSYFDITRWYAKPDIPHPRKPGGQGEASGPKLLQSLFQIPAPPPVKPKWNLFEVSQWLEDSRKNEKMTVSPFATKPIGS